MMTTAEGGLAYQRWLATINQVCGHFAARPLEGRFHGEIDARYAGSLKVSTVTAAGVNLYRTRNEIKRDNDAWFYTVFQLAGEAVIEQDDRQVTLAAGDITLIDAPARALSSGSRPRVRLRCCCRASGWRRRAR
ncbi:DNA-binding transcriptional activator FeaR [Klebsiella quasipneumoniae]|nr:DNA-binding transcriptional activator FeaR [Klebsiella quasipneumoniae]